MIRAVAKSAVERGLVMSGAAALGRRRMSGRTIVLAYHNVVPDDAPRAGDLANHLPLSRFTAQMTQLVRTHDVVPLSAMLDEAPRSNRPRAAVTFDDAYRGALLHAVPVLARMKLPATIFVAPEFIGGKSFWWDALAVAGTGLEPDMRNRALGELRGEDAAIRAWARSAGKIVSDVPPLACAASEAELLHAASYAGIALGSHTWGHPNLPKLSPSERALELQRPLEWLRQRAPNTIPWIAYPYGLFDDAVEREASACGYRAALAIEGGWVPRTPTRLFAIPRLNIPPGLSLPGFALRCAGLFGG